MSTALIASTANSQQALLDANINTLNKPSPNTLELFGHEGEVLCVQFSPSGKTLASSSADKTIRLVSVYGENEKLLTLKGHKGAVTEFQWAVDGDRLFSCSSDHEAGVWDLIAGQRTKRLIGHEDILNSCAGGKQNANLLVTGSDDGSTKMWDLRVNRAVSTFTGRYQVLSVAFDDITHRVFAGSLDNQIRVFDVRYITNASIGTSTCEDITTETTPVLTLKGHVNAITGIALSSCNGLLISNSMDQSVRLWDARPYCTRGEESRCINIIRGPTHNFEQILHRAHFSPDSLSVSIGSADRCAYIFSIEGVETGIEQPRLLYRLPGHSGPVTDICFHPNERIVATCGTDRRVFIKRLG